MAAGRTTRTALLRVLLCALLALSITAPQASTEFRTEGHERPVQIFALADRSPAVLAHRGGVRVDQAKQRTPIHWAFALVPPDGGGSERGGFRRIGEDARPQSRCAAKVR